MSPGIVIGALLAVVAQAGGADVPDAAKLAKIDTAGSTAQVAPGKDGKLVLAIVPTGTADAPTHLETAFPVKVTLTAAGGASVAKDKLSKVDATQLDRKGIRFEVPLKVVSPGQHEIRAQVKFAVCIEDPKTTETRVCLPQDRQVVFVVKGK